MVLVFLVVEDVEITAGEVLMLVFLVVEDVEMAAGVVLVLEDLTPRVVEDFVDEGEVELATSELLVLELFTGVRRVLDDEDEPATGVMLVLEP